MKKIAVVTGASSGMGREFALTLEKHFNVDEIWAIARNEKALSELGKQVNAEVRAISMDLTDPESFEKYEKALEEEQPEICLLVNASGFGIFDSVSDMRMKDSDDMVDLNCKALVKMTKMSLPYMHEGSKIINIASMAAFQPIPYIDVYGASKAFVLSFSRALNSELETRRIQAMAVCPYWTRTRFFDRAVGEKQIVKKYIVMYEPEMIIKQAWKDLEKGKDISIYGTIAKGQAALCKILPHKLVMNIWKKQQDLH